METIPADWSIQTNQDLYYENGGNVFIGDSTSTPIGATLTIDGDSLYTKLFNCRKR